VNEIRAVAPEQIRAATAIHDRFMPGWRSSDETLELLAGSFPRMDLVSVIAKACAVNYLYNTKCPEVIEVAQAIVAGLVASDGREVSLDEALELAAAVAPVTDQVTGKTTYYWSFASKFLHWFVSDAAPMYDGWASKAVASHVGPIKWGGPPDYYPRFVAAIGRLQEASGLTCTARELDRFLWLWGMYDAWLGPEGKDKARISQEARHLFKDARGEVRATLGALMGTREGAGGV
jgi:hypothetical protein